MWLPVIEFWKTIYIKTAHSASFFQWTPNVVQFRFVDVFLYFDSHHELRIFARNRRREDILCTCIQLYKAPTFSRPLNIKLSCVQWFTASYYQKVRCIVSIFVVRNPWFMIPGLDWSLLASLSSDVYFYNARPKERLHVPSFLFANYTTCEMQMRLTLRLLCPGC